MAWFKWFRRSKTDDTVEDEIKELTSQFHTTLRANYARAQMATAKPSPETAQRLKALLEAKPSRWGDAYEVEQMLVDLYDEQVLKTESAVRALEARKSLNPELAGFYETEMKDATPVERRSLLARLVNDLQWRYTVNEVKRRYSKDITSRTGTLFTWSLVAFAAGTTFVVLMREAKYEFYPDVALMFIAALAGTWGAAFSMLASLKGRLEICELDDMKLIQPWVMLLSRALIGTGAGCVLYFLVRSGLLGGEAFPEPEELVEKNFDSLALLIIWCFIAGFSEKLVPSLLEKNMARVSGTGAADAERYRPSPAPGAPRGDSPRTSAGESGKPPQESPKKTE